MQPLVSYIHCKTQAQTRVIVNKEAETIFTDALTPYQLICYVAVIDENNCIRQLFYISPPIV